MKTYIKNHSEESLKAREQILEDETLINLIEKTTLEIIKAYKNGKKAPVAGNGDSAVDVQRVAGEFVSRFYFDRPGIASIALTTNISIITVIGNDYGYEKLFSRQLEAQGVSGDVFIGISTSGNSKNILEALKVCKEKGILSVGLAGESGGEMARLCDYCIKMPSPCTPRIQEARIMIGHILCAIVEEELFGKSF